MLAVASTSVFAQQSDEEVAKAVQNPIAPLISLPLQYNYDHEIGSQQTGHRNHLNVQPVIPISIGEDWNRISRTIVSRLGRSRHDDFPVSEVSERASVVRTARAA